MRIDEPTHGYMATITEDEALPKALALMHLKKYPGRRNYLIYIEIHIFVKLYSD